MSDSVRPHRRQPIRFPRPRDSPGKNTGVGCHFLLQCMKVKSESEVIQSCPTLSDSMDCSLPGSSIHGIFQARVWSGVPLPSLTHTHTHILINLTKSHRLELIRIVHISKRKKQQLNHHKFLKNIAAKAVILIHKTESIWRRKVAFYIQS